MKEIGQIMNKEPIPLFNNIDDANGGNIEGFFCPDCFPDKDSLEPCHMLSLKSKWARVCTEEYTCTNAECNSCWHFDIRNRSWKKR